MPYEDPDPTDPMTFHGVEVETDDPGAMDEMALCFVEEYARLGLSGEAILKIFADGGYAGPALAMRHLGRDRIAATIERQLRLRGPQSGRVPVERSGSGALSLPVLEI